MRRTTSFWITTRLRRLIERFAEFGSLGLGQDESASEIKLFGNPCNWDPQVQRIGSYSHSVCRLVGGRDTSSSEFRSGHPWVNVATQQTVPDECSGRLLICGIGCELGSTFGLADMIGSKRKETVD
uniref:Uncharacterized protein n=1 Tax=Ananas comosus var. bracteatus TaxID=296719 RepID=A0A6V7PQ01_ANACO|nr:unnamed protein product [Ananas comosus var. bracteatus]